MIYLYGLLDPNASPSDVNLADLPGVTGPVEVTEMNECYLIYSPHDGAETLPKRRYLLAHARTLEYMITLGSVLPMRFGMYADDLNQVDILLREQSKLIAGQFEKIRGRVEIGVRVSFDQKDALNCLLEETPQLWAERNRLMQIKRGAHFEHAEFGRRLSEALERRRLKAQKKLLESILPLVSDYKVRDSDEDAQVIAMDVLIAECDQEMFADSLSTLALNCGFAPGFEPQIQLIGPVPSYNFVKIALGGRVAEAV